MHTAQSAAAASCVRGRLWLCYETDKRGGRNSFFLAAFEAYICVQGELPLPNGEKLDLGAVLERCLVREEHGGQPLLL
jgi:hypothetical protein